MVRAYSLSSRAHETSHHLAKMANVVLDSVNQVTNEDINRKVQVKMDKINSDWANLPKEHNLSKFSAALKDILAKAGYNEMYGVELIAPAEEGCVTLSAQLQNSTDYFQARRHHTRPSSSSRSSFERMSTISSRRKSSLLLP